MKTAAILLMAGFATSCTSVTPRESISSHAAYRNRSWDIPDPIHEFITLGHALSVGMSPNQVVEVLGESPRKHILDERSVCWIYATTITAQGTWAYWVIFDDAVLVSWYPARITYETLPCTSDLLVGIAEPLRQQEMIGKD